MARLVYCLLLYLASPLVWLRLFWRSRRQPGYREHLAERWGRYPQPAPAAPLIWVHAVSVGETRAAQPLVEGLLAAYPDHQLLLTGMTPTGRAAALQLFGAVARVRLAYLPYDYPGAVERFLRHFSPRLGVLMETEIWPNLLAAAARRQIPVLLVNARLSHRSARGYRRIAALVRPALQTLAAVAAQTGADASRLAGLGARHIHVCGNLKFDVAPQPELLALGQAWRQALGRRPVWLAASTREGEEALLLDVLKALAGAWPGLLLVLVPRHPQRFEAVAQQLAQEGLACQRRSQGLPGREHQVWLGDSMGEMAAYYRLADMAFIGGSLVPLGGQNLIEAAACGCPALVGPHTFNFSQATEDAIAAGAARRVRDPLELRQTLEALLEDPDSREKMGQAGLAFWARHRGATRRILDLIRSDLPAAGR